MHDAKLNKAALAELDALGRHLRKGRDITTWEPRHLQPVTLNVVAQVLAKGRTVDQAVDIARASLLSGDPDDEQEGD